MKHKILKAVACLSLVMMVFSAITPGAFADDNTTAVSDTEKFSNHKIGHGLSGGIGMNNSSLEAMEFDSEEEEMEFLTEKANESIRKKIEKLNEMLENIDEIDDENVTEDSIQEQIDELDALLEDIENATTLDELQAIMEEARDLMMPTMKGGNHGMSGDRPEMEFETEEEEMEFLVERANESISNKIEELNETLANIDEIDDETVTEDSIQEQIDELETFLEEIESATTLDELQAIMEEYRESYPHQHGHGRGHGPMSFDSQEEEVTTE